MNDLTTFMPLNTKIGGQARCIKDKEAICLMNDQARHVYKKIDSESIINVDTFKQEMEKDLDKIDKTIGKRNPYHEIIVKRQKEMIQSYHKWNNDQY